MGNFPQKAVGIGDIPTVSAPENRLRRLENAHVFLGQCGEQGIHLSPAANIVHQGEARKAAAVYGRYLGVPGQGIYWIQGQKQGATSLEKGDVLVALRAFLPQPKTS